MKTWKDLLGALEPREREPLEIRTAVLDAIEELAQPLGGGRRGLVHNRVTVKLLSADPARRDLLHAVLTAEPGLLEAVTSRLEAAGCSVPLDLTVEAVKDAPAHPGAAGAEFELAASIEKPAAARRDPAAPARAARPGAKLIVFSGAGAAEFEITSDVVNIGRVQEVRGKDHRPVRRNHLFFTEAETGVSRQHAHIRYDSETGEFRIFDDRSARGTRLFSRGEAIDVPPGRGRGELLHSGDEIYFGSVGVRFETD